MHRARADLVNQASDCNELDRTLCHQSRCQHDVRDASEESLHATLCSHNKHCECQYAWSLSGVQIVHGVQYTRL